MREQDWGLDPDVGGGGSNVGYGEGCTGYGEGCLYVGVWGGKKK